MFRVLLSCRVGHFHWGQVQWLRLEIGFWRRCRRRIWACSRPTSRRSCSDPTPCWCGRVLNSTKAEELDAYASSPLPPSLRRGASHSRLTPNARSASTTCGRKLAPGDAGSERPVAHLSNRRRTQVGETSPGRVLPVVFDVRHKSKHDVDRTVPDDLAIDMSSCPI